MLLWENCKYAKRGNERGKGDRYAYFEKIGVSEFEVMVFENRAPHNPRQGTDGGKASTEIGSYDRGIYSRDV